MVIKSKSDCTGCGACQNICPHNAIIMKPDEEGFIYPYATDKCVRCGLCESICPLHNEVDLEKLFGSFRKEPSLIKALSKDVSVWQKSSSGGAFYEICKLYPRDSILVGAEMRFPEVQHSIVDFSSVERILRSKYIQSKIGSVFSAIDKHVSTGKNIVFCGTPCQVAGLLAFLGKRPENLLTVEFICHGNGSPFVFKQFIQEVEKKNKISVLNYQFRVKPLNEESFTFVSAFTLRDNAMFYKSLDAYNQLYLGQLCLRPCCGENCKFRTTKRNADVTLGDLKGEVLQDTDGCVKNASVVIANTDKGSIVLGRLKNSMISFDYSLDELIRVNPLYDHTTPENPKRNSFFKELRKGKSLQYLSFKYAEIPRLQKKALLFYSKVKNFLSGLRFFKYHSDI